MAEQELLKSFVKFHVCGWYWSGTGHWVPLPCIVDYINFPIVDRISGLMQRDIKDGGFLDYIKNKNVPCFVDCIVPLIIHDHPTEKKQKSQGKVLSRIIPGSPKYE